MTVQAMNHFTILTDDVGRTVGFYGELLGLSAGPRPDFNFPGAWLYASGAPILHVIGGRPKSELRAGVIDHMAFSGRELPGLLAKLDAGRIEHTCRRQVGSGVWQVFFFDPNGARVEIDFPAEETAPGRE
ncbi:MAG TPA: VOC family protein [Casimicrobiaceae bacterium]|nr:VOC family protein [Casimicrobiaceae bacterium]